MQSYVFFLKLAMFLSFFCQNGHKRCGAELLQFRIPVAPNDSISAVSEFPLLRTTVFPRFQDSRHSERQHFHDFRIPIAPNDSISAISELRFL